MSKTKILGLIPARGGSKGILKKNLYPFNNKPLIEWTIESARNSNILDEIIVSTDDDSIANFSKRLGVNVPFLRDKKLAEDNSLIIDTVLDLIEKFNHYSHVLLLQPTSPLRTHVDIKNIINIRKEYNAESVVSVSESKENPALFFNINKNNYLSKSFENEKGSNRQTYKQYYVLNGALFLASLEHLKEFRSFISKSTIPYIMPLERSIDIDNILDLKWGEFILKNKNL